MNWPLQPTLLTILLLPMAACGGVQHTVRTTVPAPRTVAVLPFAGTADAAVRDSARLLVHSRLHERGLRVVDCTWVDRVLSERGWLTDPASFDPAQLPLAQVTAALGVDAIALGRDLEDSRFNLLLVRRHAFGGRLELQLADGGAWWASDHRTSNLGGLLLASGQVFTELRAQGAHGTPMATLALVDEFVEDVLATVPMQELPPVPGSPPLLHAARCERLATATGERLVVEVQADPGAAVRFDAPPLTGVPMAPVPGQPDRYRGAHDLAAGSPALTVTILARDAFGREVRIEAKP